MAEAVAVLGGLAEVDVELGTRTTYRVGGTAAVGVTASGLDDLVAVGDAVRASGLDVVVVGNGSNLLVADDGFAGIAVTLGPGFAEVDVRGGEVVAGGATPLPVLARRTAAAGLTGLEWAVGVPGTVGGGVRMNAGGHGSDLAASLRHIHAFDLRTGHHCRVAAADLDLGYRHSSVGTATVVLDATFDLAPGDATVALAAVAEVVRWRRAHQPGGHNAGSVFTNPVGAAAGALIDAAGCRGLRLGSAQVSSKHANFIQADEGGSAADVVALMELVRSRVRAATDVELRAEVKLLGFGPPQPQRQLESEVGG